MKTRAYSGLLEVDSLVSIVPLLPLRDPGLLGRLVGEGWRERRLRLLLLLVWSVPLLGRLLRTVLPVVVSWLICRAVLWCWLAAGLRTRL